MSENENQPILKAHISNQTLSNWVSHSNLSANLKTKLQNVNVLLIPRIGYLPDDKTPVFPSGTSDIFQFIKSNKTDAIIIDAGTDDESYKELGLHFDVMSIVNMIVHIEVAREVFGGLVVEYITSKLGNRASETNLQMKFSIQEDDTVVDFSYDGPASQYKDTIKTTLDSWSEYKIQIHEASKSGKSWQFWK